MLNTNLNQFSVIRNLEDFVPSTVNFLLELEFNTCTDLQEEILNTPLGADYSLEENYYIPYYFTPKAVLQARKNINWIELDKQEDTDIMDLF